MKCVGSLGVSLIILFGVLAGAGAADDAAVCADRVADDASRVAACTRVIASAHFSRASAYLAQGELDRAIADYDELIRNEPTNSSHYLARGDLYQRKGEHDEAAADYGEALRLDPGNPDAEAKLAQSTGELAKVRAAQVADKAVDPPSSPSEPQSPAAEARPVEKKECISSDTSFQGNGKAATFVIALQNNCEKRVKCTVNAYVVNSFGPNTGRAVLTLAAKSKGAAARKSYVMKVKQAGGMASVSRSCADL